MYMYVHTCNTLHIIICNHVYTRTSMSLSRFLNSSMADNDRTPPQLLLDRKSTGLMELGTVGNRSRKSSSPPSIFLPVSRTLKKILWSNFHHTRTYEKRVLYVLYVYMYMYVRMHYYVYTAHLKGDLRCEDELVCLKQASSGVHEHRVGDAVDQILNSLLHIVRLGSSVNCIVEHYTECLHEEINKNYRINLRNTCKM